MNSWQKCKRILVIRLDNMGDLIMSSPAIKALKESFGAHITVLTSSMAAGISRLIPVIDETIIYDVPWVKLGDVPSADSISEIVDVIREKRFDGTVIFTVFSQNPLPAVMLAYMANIPLRLAYCRENPYALLTDWVPEEEPYTTIKHQVRRDLDLVKTIGASTGDERLLLSVSGNKWNDIQQKVLSTGCNVNQPWLIVHAGVSEKKREYPFEKWIETARLITAQLNVQVLLTGSEKEKEYVGELKQGIGAGAFSLAGLLSLEEFVTLISKAPLIISVNTGTIHIAAATNTPVIVLYALTNPQHAPWKAPGKALIFDVPEEARSKNEILKYVRDKYYPKEIVDVTPEEIFEATREIVMSPKGFALIPELILI